MATPAIKLIGTTGDDRLVASNQNFISGGAGNDQITLNGSGTVDGGAGNDTIFGSWGRGLFIEADCLEDAEARACLMARGDEAIESVRQFARA